MTLSAKLNEQIYYSKDITDDFGKQNKFNCIGCKGELIFHRNISGTRTQHWAHKNDCPFETEPESQEHITYKEWCYEHIKAPTKHQPDSVYVGDQKPDVFLEFPNFAGVKQVAIEVQCAKISLEQIIERTKKYTEKGIYVFWILGTNYELTPQFGKLNNTKSFSVTEDWLQSIYFGRIYYFERFDSMNVCIRPVKLLWNGYKKSRFMSKSKDLFFSNIELNLTESIDRQGNKYLIARLWDKMWW